MTLRKCGSELNTPYTLGCSNSLEVVNTNEKANSHIFQACAHLKICTCPVTRPTRTSPQSMYLSRDQANSHSPQEYEDFNTFTFPLSPFTPLHWYVEVVKQTRSSPEKRSGFPRHSIDEANSHIQQECEDFSTFTFPLSPFPFHLSPHGIGK